MGSNGTGRSCPGLQYPILRRPEPDLDRRMAGGLKTPQGLVDRSDVSISRRRPLDGAGMGGDRHIMTIKLPEAWREILAWTVAGVTILALCLMATFPYGMLQ